MLRNANSGTFQSSAKILAPKCQVKLHIELFLQEITVYSKESDGDSVSGPELSIVLAAGGACGSEFVTTLVYIFIHGMQSKF